jgi:hypothetical protein
MSLTAAFIFALVTPPAGPQTPTKERATESKTTDTFAVMKQAAGLYRFRADAGDAAAVLIADPILRWSNPVAQEDDAGLFLWTRQGRPEAAAQFFVRKNLWMHEFQSLSEGTFTVNWNGQTVWSPRQAGLKFEPIPDSPPPDRNATVRLRQMRTIADSFTAAVEFQYDKDSHYELRLLPRPVYRYRAGDGDALDGTLWAFVQGTNPEVLLLIESRLTPDRALRWNYAFAAMTSYPAEAKRNGTSVWKVGRQPIPTPNTLGPYVFRYDVPIGDGAAAKR